MRCEECGAPTRIRRGKLTCDHCDGAPRAQPTPSLGFVVVDMRSLRRRSKRPIFRTWAMAERWIAIRGLVGAEVHAVSLPHRIEWRRPGGQLAGIELADQSFHLEINVTARPALGGA